MARIIVSLVSKETTPNVFFIREMGGADKYVFVTTKQMEEKNKTDAIIEAAHLNPANCDRILVVDDSVPVVEEEIKNYLSEHLEDNDEILVNLTCGTKLMSIALYNVMKEKGARIFYLPIGKNIYKQIFPERKVREFVLNYRINLADYLAAYGIQIEKKSFPLQPEEYTHALFKKFLREEIPKEMLANLRTWAERSAVAKKLKKQGIPFIDVDNSVKTLLKIAEYPIENNTLFWRDIAYLRGGWFEEEIYNRIYPFVKGDENIGLSVHIARNDVKNEADVMFVKDNALFIIECKTGLKYNGRNAINEALYKLAAIRQDFGLFVHSYLFSLEKSVLNNTGELRTDYLNRARLLNIRYIGLNILGNDEDFDRFLRDEFSVGN